MRPTSLARLVPSTSLLTGLAAAMLALAAGSADAVVPIRTLGNDQAGTNFYAEQTRSAGDVNGDGYLDILIATRANTAPGWFDVFFGGPGADATSDWRVPDSQYGFGPSLYVVPAGDFNNDGYDDILAGDRLDNTVYLFYGGPSPDTVADLVFTGNANEEFGVPAGIGDVNGDGRDDIAIGATRAPFGSTGGRVFLYWGGPSPNNVPDRILADESGLIGDYLGESVAAGDIDGDGVNDVIVGTTKARGLNNLDDEGRVYIFLGGAAADSVHDYIHFGDTVNTQFGQRVAFAGDVNGDGYGDYMASESSSTNGSVHLFVSTLGSSWHQDLVLTGELAFDNFGYDLGAAGDVNNDGFDDVIVGTPYHQSNVGKAYIYHGGFVPDATPDLVIVGSQTENLAYSVAGVGDVDFDGYDDFIVGSTRRDVGPNVAAGAAVIYSARPFLLDDPTGGETWTSGEVHTVRWRGANPADVALSLDGGLSWSTVGRVVGGRLVNTLEVVAPPQLTEHARIRVSYASQTATPATSVVSPAPFRIAPPSAPVSDRGVALLPGEAPGDEFGSTVAGVGDVDGDGREDFLVGAFRNDAAGSWAGRAYLYLGASPETPSLVFTGAAASDFFGSAVAGAGDVNGDGYADFLIGAEGVDPGGAGYLYLGGPGLDTTPELTLLGVNDAFGGTAAGLGDINGDGFADFAFGAAANNTNGSSSGAVYVFFGSATPDATPDLVQYGEGTFHLFGEGLTGLGDMNGDGYSDFAASSYTAGGRGYVYGFLGGPVPDIEADFLLVGEPGDLMGVSLAGPGDVNGDGYDDLLAGAIGGSSAPGRAYLFLGSAVVDTDPDLILEGEAPGSDFGFVGGLGDVNRDGLADFGVGSPALNLSGAAAGAAYVYFGSTSLDDSPDKRYLGTPGQKLGRAVDGAGDLDADGFDDLLVAGENQLGILDFNRYHLEVPFAGDVWNVGSQRVVRWKGAEPADLWLSVDGGNAYTLLASDVGGSAVNTFNLIVPHQPTRFARLRVAPHDPSVTGTGESDSLFTIDASIALLSLAVETIDDGGVLLSWSTDPGPEDLAGYLVERSTDASHWTQLASGLRETSYLDPDGAPGMHYRLSGINGLGEALVLGEAAVAPRAILSAWPLPFRGDRMTVSFLTAGGLGGGPGHAQVRVFDIRGAQVRTLVDGEFPAGFQQVTWDGRDDVGRRVPDGIYFLQAVSGGQAARVKVLVLR